MPNVITDNAALFIGLLRALFLFLVAWGVMVSQAQQDATLGLVAALIPLISLAFTVWTIRTTVPRTPSAIGSGAAIQTPPPGTVLTTISAANADAPVPASDIIATPTAGVLR